MIHSEFFSSKREAKDAARALAQHNCYRCEVHFVMRANMTHDWQLQVWAA